MNIIEKAKEYGMKCHADTNHLYDGRPYAYHLDFVYQVAKFFSYLLPESEKQNILAACWVHDVIEDTRQTYNDVKHATNERVADIAYALTNEKGRNRKERANANYYIGIRNTEGATFVKLCDRIANVQHSAQKGKNGMFEVYKDENEIFLNSLWSDGNKLADMFEVLENLAAGVDVSEAYLNVYVRAIIHA